MPGRAIDRRSALLLLVGVGGASAAAEGCSHGDAGRTAAERFVDAYYVEIDLSRARDEAVGLARAKVEDQMKLLSGQAMPDPASRPSVHYRFLEQDQAARANDRRGYLFELTISFDGGEQIHRRALVTVAQESDAWHAANFQEID